jgi:hypothetical protein
LKDAAIEYNNYLQLNVPAGASWRDIKLAGQHDYGYSQLAVRPPALTRFMANLATHWLPSILLVGVLALAGCGKSGKSSAQGVPAAMDLPKFQQAFASATPEQQVSATKVHASIRYGLYPDALAALAKLDGDATLTGPQKQAVTNMIEGIKQTMAKAPAAPAQ